MPSSPRVTIGIPTYDRDTYLAEAVRSCLAQDYADHYQTRTGLTLNKVTPFQVKQYLVEAGFKVVHWQLIPVPNDPPPELAERFGAMNLTTGAVLFAADRPG